jgi:hypothetical protein
MGAPATLCRCLDELVNSAVAESQRRVAHQHQIEYAEIASSCQQSLGGRGQPGARHQFDVSLWTINCRQIASAMP